MPSRTKTAEAEPRPHRRYAPRMAAAKRREQLLDTALAVIVSQGYSRVSIESIARAAGVTRPVVYDHFRDLGELLHALIEREERYSLEQMAHVLPQQPELLHPAAAFTGTVRRFLDAVTTRPATWTLILLPLEGTPEIVRQHVEANRGKVLAQMEAVVRWAIDRTAESGETESGQTPSDRSPRPVDVELAARAILGLAEDAGRMVLTDRQRYSPDRYERFVKSIMTLLWPE